MVLLAVPIGANALATKNVLKFLIFVVTFSDHSSETLNVSGIMDINLNIKLSTAITNLSAVTGSLELIKMQNRSQNQSLSGYQVFPASKFNEFTCQIDI